MTAAILLGGWNGWRARYARSQSNEDLELPTRRIPESRNVHTDAASPDTSSAHLEEPEIHPTRDRAKVESMGVNKKSRLFTRQRWRKSLRFIRLFVWPFSFLKYIMLPPMRFDDSTTSASAFFLLFDLFSFKILPASVFMAWDIWRMLHSLYEHPPGYRTEILLVIETCIMVASVLDVAKDISVFILISVPAYYALIGLPAMMLSMCIAGGHVWRYPARRRERIRYAKIKPQLAFTASGIPVAVYPTRGMFGASEMDLLSVDSLQEHPDSQADQPEHHHSEFYDATGYTNESQVSLLSERATTSFAIHGELGTAVHRPIQPTQWLGDSPR